MGSAMRWKDLWTVAGLTAALDGLAIGVWTTMAWGLRGAGHDGRPAAGIEAEQAIALAAVALAALAHLGFAAFGLAAGRREGWIGSLAGLAALPISYPLGLLVSGTLGRLIFG